jgi:hypothetical protein
MNPQVVKLGPGIRAICDKLINELNQAIIKNSESSNKVRDFKHFIKTEFWPYTKRMPKIIKGYEKIIKDGQAMQTLNQFYFEFETIINQLEFVNKMSELYIFPEFNLTDATDLLFSGCSNNLKQELTKSNLLNGIPSRNLYGNNDVNFLINNDFNSKDDKTNNILLDKNNNITKKIVEQLSKKLEEFNNYIALNEEGSDINNFKLFLNEYICAQIYNNFVIKFILVQKSINNRIYFILPIEINYNKEIINLNDKEEIFIDKNKILSKNDLQYFIDKFKPKQIINRKKNKSNEEINVEIEKLTKDDFLQKCLLFKEYTKSLFNDKFESLKKNIVNFINKYDFPISVEDSIDNASENMDIDSKDENNNKNNNISQFTIYFNFSIVMKQKNEFYIKLIYDKNNPTIIKMVFSHNNLSNKENTKNNHIISNLFIEQVEKTVLFDLKQIKNEISKYYEDYKHILLIWIYKKLKYLYSTLFDVGFQLNNTTIQFGIKSSMDHTIISRKLFDFYINDLGKFTFNDLYSTKIFLDDFKEINFYITNFLKNVDNDIEQNEYITKFNNYINNIIIEKVFIFPGINSKLKELNYEANYMKLFLYNSYYTDKNIFVYFELNCEIIKGKTRQEVPHLITCFKIKDISLICENKKNNNKIISKCIRKNDNNKDKIFEFNSQYLNLSIVADDLNKKYELFMLYAWEIINFSQKIESPFELSKTVEINLNDSNKINEDWFELSVENKNIDIFKPNYRENLLKYFSKIKFSKNNNNFQFYLRPEIFKKKYLNDKNVKVIENYSMMPQQYIIGYDYKEDYISIIILSKLKIGYFSILKNVFETILLRIITFMNKTFKLIDYLKNNDPAPLMMACPILLTLQIKTDHSFIKHINFKFIDKDPFFMSEGNFNNVFNLFVKDFGLELICNEFDYNNKKYYLNKAKFFKLGFKLYDLLMNTYQFKMSLIVYPYNHFKPNNQNIQNIYFLVKDFDVLELISLNNILLTIQIKNENSLYLEFVDNSIVDDSNMVNRIYLNSFNTEIGKLDDNIIDQIMYMNNNKAKIIIKESAGNKSIDLIKKLEVIINIFRELSKN